MKLLEKLWTIQCSIDAFVKDNVIGEGKSSYKAVGSEQVLNEIRPLLNELKLLVEPSVEAARVTTDKTSSGTTRYFTELDMVMTWVDVESGETRPVKWYGQGTDLAGEKGVGKANTYAEKYFFMKYFHVPTPKDDPDSDARTKTGELKKTGTQAAKETQDLQRQSVVQMLNHLCGGDADKIKASVIAFTENKVKGYEGVDSVDSIKPAALPVVYAAVKKKYKERTGTDFEFKQEDTENAG